MVTIAQARQTFEQQQVQVQEAGQKLAEAQRKLPQLTQRELRRGGYAGMRGALRRKQIQKAKRELEAKQKMVGGYGEQLSEYEKRIITAEKQKATYEREKRAIEQAYKHFEKGISPYWLEGEPEYKYLKQLYKLERSGYAVGLQPARRPTISSGYLPGIDISKLTAPTLPPIKGLFGETISQPTLPTFDISKPGYVRDISIPSDFDISKISAPIDISKLTVPSDFDISKLDISKLDISPEIRVSAPTLDISKLDVSEFPEMKIGEQVISPEYLREQFREQLPPIKPGKEIIELLKETGRVAKEKAMGVALGIAEVAGVIGEIPVVVPEPKFLPFTEKIIGGPDIRLSTIGAEAERLRTGISTTGELAKIGATVIIGLGSRPRGEELLTKTVPETTVPLYTGETGIWTPEGYIPPREITIPEHVETTELGLIPKAAKLGPEVLAYTFAPVPTLTADILAAGERKKTLEEDVKVETEKQYKEHLKEEIPEGYRYLTKEEFKLEVLPEIETKMKEQLALEVGIPLAFLGGIGAFKAFRAVTKPIITTRAPPPVQWVKEKAFVTPKGGRITTFDIYAYKPPVEARVTTQFREFVGMKPKVDWTPITKPQLEVFRPAAGSYVLGRAPYVAELGKVSKVPYGITTKAELEALARIRARGRLKLFEVSGKAEIITPKEIMKLPPAEKYVWTGKPGVLVTREGEELSQALIRTYQYFGKPGRQIQTFYTGARVKPRIQIGDIKVFETEMGFKETTMPFYRAAGKIPRLRGTLIEIPLKEPPLWAIDLTGVKFKPPLPGMPPPTLKVPPTRPFQWLEQLPKTKPIIPPPPAEMLKPITAPVIKEVVGKGFPLMVGGRGREVLDYSTFLAGGMFPLVSAQVIGPVPKVEVGIKEEAILKPVEVSVLREKIIPKLEITPRLKEKVGVIPKVAVIPKEALKAGVISKVIPKVIPKVKMVPKVATKVVSRVISRPRPRPKLRPLKIIPKIPPYLKKEKEKRKKLKKRKPELVVPYVRRYGIYIPISKPITFEKAIKKGKARLLATLGAALQIRKVTGEPIKIAEETRIFRAGKKGKDPFTLIQRRRARLKAPTEVQEIIAARKAARIKFLK